MKLRPYLFFVLILILIFSSACTANQPVEPVVDEPEAPTATTAAVLPTPTATEVPKRDLVICMGEEPISLYMYGYNSNAMWSVLEAIYDGPFDTVNYETEAVIFEALPSIENQGWVNETVTVNQGDLVVNSDGVVVPLISGTQLYPVGCQDKACVLTYDGETAVEMQRTTLTYHLLPGMLWSDGEALTAADSVFSYQIANDPAAQVKRFYLDRTASYSAIDAATVVWQGLPGYQVLSPADFFWLPLPQHRFGELSAAELLENADAARAPLGWGPYQVDEWVFGDHLTLSKNPNYFRADEGLPKFDRLVFRFLGPHADSNLKALEIGECDFIDPSVQLDEQLVDVVERNNLGQLSAYFGQGPEVEQLAFGIVPASYDDGYNAAVDRQDLFGDVRMRQAVAYCSDRAGIANKYFVNRGLVPVGFYPPSHPAYEHSLEALPFDLEKGRALLDEIGWIDEDNDPTTPRTARGVTNVVDGTELSFNYITTQSELRLAASIDFATSLSQCGIRVNLAPLYPTELYANGPDGLMFGRNFDLAQFAWTTSKSSPCYLYTSEQIPNEGNLWIGGNVSGYQNAEFDAACEAVQQLSPADGDAYWQAEQQVQQIFYDDLPVLPLYYHLKTAAGRVDFCGFDELDISARSALWQIESFDFGASCTK